MSRPASYLLDTHVALWWFNADPRISPEREQTLGQSRCLISAATIWEVAIKHRLGKLPVAPQTLLRCAMEAGFELLDIHPRHAAATAELEPLHHDPFDRLLLAQARHDRHQLITADAALLAYGRGVERL
jgi:PIN domain nuclease of toxin-antitoxin system